MTNVNLLEALLSSAARIGANVKAEMDAARETLAKARDKRDEAQGLVTNEERASSGFAAPRFTGLTEIAADFARIFNGQDSQDSRDAATAAAKSFTASFTGQTDKSAQGGKGAGYAATISLGSRAETLRVALQSRLDHWQAEHDSDVEGESAALKAERRATARRYLTPCGDALMEDGSLPVDSNGVPKTPKFNGRPARVVDGVSIPFGRGTNRDSQMAEASRLFAQYGDRVLTSGVLDALLDNGGRYKPESDESLSTICANARGLVDKLMAQGGSASGDAAFLTAMHTVLGRIMAEGFKASMVSDAPTGTAVPDDAPRADYVVRPGEEDSAPAGESDPLAGVGGDPVAPEAPEGEGVTLGAPAASKRPRRARKGEEVQAGA